MLRIKVEQKKRTHKVPLDFYSKLIPKHIKNSFLGKLSHPETKRKELIEMIDSNYH